MKSKKIALVAGILMATLVVGVYAVIQLSNTLTTSWTLIESGDNLVLYWAAPHGQPTGNLNRGQWTYASIGLENIGEATYTVTDKFTITTGPAIPADCMTIEYWDGSAWVDMTGVLTYDGGTVTGYFGPLAGFTVIPGYDVVTSFRIMFDGNALLTDYTFAAWVEQI